MNSPVSGITPSRIADDGAAAPIVTLSTTTQLSSRLISRDQVYGELVSIYSETMEYLPEVFSEDVELDAELGIDLATRLEIYGRVRSRYNLPPLPPDCSSDDLKTMRQVVDFVFTHQNKAASAA